MAKQDKADAFARFRAGFNDDIALWQWLFDKGDYNEALQVILPVVNAMQKYKQIELLGRYAHNLACTYQKLGLEMLALDAYRIAYLADVAVHGKKEAKKMLAYTSASHILGWQKSWHEKAKSIFFK